MANGSQSKGGTRAFPVTYGLAGLALLALLVLAVLRHLAGTISIQVGSK